MIPVYQQHQLFGLYNFIGFAVRNPHMKASMYTPGVYQSRTCELYKCPFDPTRKKLFVFYVGSVYESLNNQKFCSHYHWK